MGVVALTLVAAACGGSSESEELAQVGEELDALKEQAATTTAAPTTTAASARTVTTTEPPTTTAAITVASRPVVPGCTDIVRRLPAFVEGIADHELWIGRLVADQITDQQMLGSGWSVGDGFMIDGVTHIWAMNAADNVIHHATFANDEFTDLGPISVDGAVFQGFIDPDVFRLPDGGIGLAAVNGMRVEGTPRQPGPVCLMRSDDGQNFETVQVLLDTPGVQDPAVIVGDEWVLAVKVFNQKIIQLLVGTPDGGFETTASVPGGDPDLVMESDGSIRLTVCGDGMLKTYLSSEGRSWEPSDPIRSQTCGPAWISGSDWILHLPKPGQGGAAPIPGGGSGGPANPPPTTPAEPSSTTTTTPPTTAAPTTTTQSGVQFGVGGLAADLESWAVRDLPRFITSSHIDISDVERISRFRSNAGHDYSDSFETCCSMKHYFRTTNYYEVRFTQPIYSPVDGVVLYVAEGAGSSEDAWRVDYEQVTGKSPPSDYRDLKMYIRPDDAPNLWVRFHHVYPVEEILNIVPLSSEVDMMRGLARPAAPGFRVSAGDLVAHGVGEISVERHLDGNGVPSPCTAESQRSSWGGLPGCASKRQFHSIFEFMTDEVFDQYRAVADVTRDDFMISTEERSANPLMCEGEDFVTRDVGAYVFLQGSPEIEQSMPTEEPAAVEVSLPSTESLADGRTVLASFDGPGAPQLESFDAVDNYALVIASDSGPIKVTVDDGSGERSIYHRPESSGISTYETSALGTGNISVTVEATEQVGWRIVVIALP